MRRLTFALAAVIATTVYSVPAQAGVTAIIDLSSQTMTVKVGKKVKYTWVVSTGKPGFETPVGTFPARRMYRDYYSTNYKTQMPNSIFFAGADAIHGTNATGSLGKPVSHGCVRLAPGNAKKLFNLVLEHGRRNTRILVVP